MADCRQHWEPVYAGKASDRVSGFQPLAALSLNGGASTRVHGTDPDDRARYVGPVLNSVKPGGHVIVAAFGPDGPLQCSGLEVMRYAPDALHAEFGAAFRLLGHETEIHHPPAGKAQEFVYCYCVRT